MKKRYPAAILATCCIPWKRDGSFAEEFFRRNVRRLAAQLTPHLYLFGTAGEGYAVTDKQFDRIIRVFRQEMNAAGGHPMIGIISLSLGTVMERITRARDLGFRQFQISLPAWGALNQRELMVFFDRVCSRFPDCEFLHYNLLRTKRLVTPEEYARVAREFPNFVATKNSTDSRKRITALMKGSPQLQHFFTEPGYGYASLQGECGLLISVASINFLLGRNYFEAGQNRETRRVRAMQQELVALTNDLIAAAGNAAHMDGAYDKLFCKMHDRNFPPRLLPPYEAFGDETFRKILQVIRRKYPDWLARAE